MPEKTPSNRPLPPQQGTMQKGRPAPGKSTAPASAPSGKTGSTPKDKQKK